MNCSNEKKNLSQINNLNRNQQNQLPISESEDCQYHCKEVSQDSSLKNAQNSIIGNKTKPANMNSDFNKENEQNCIQKIDNNQLQENESANNQQEQEEDPQISQLLQKAQEERDNLQHVPAEQHYKEVLELQKQKYGPISNQVSSTYKKLASMFSKIRDFDAALHYNFEALKIFASQSEQGKHSSREATCLISISNIYLTQENISEAQAYVSRALNLYNSQTLEDEQMKPMLISQALRLKRKIDAHEKQKQFEERQIALSQEQSVCSICLEDIQRNNKVRQLNCGHVFHIQCIGQWLSQNSKCPYCRDTLPKAI